MISITGIQVQLSKEDLSTRCQQHLHSFRNGTRRRWHHGPWVWTIPLLLPFGSLHLGKKGYMVALPRAVPALLCMDCPPRDTWSPAMYRTPATTWPRDLQLHCARTLYLLLHLPSCNHGAWTALQRCSPWGLHLPRLLHTNWPKGIYLHFDLSPASRNRPGGLCWLIRCKASHKLILMAPHTSPSNLLYSL